MIILDDPPPTEEPTSHTEDLAQDPTSSSELASDVPTKEEHAETPLETSSAFFDPSSHVSEGAAASTGETTGEADALASDDGAGDQLLDQSEIDSLLGNAFGDFPVHEETGMERIIRAGFASYERLPMLEIIFDRLVRILSSTLRSFTNDNVEITIESIRSMSFGDYMNTVPSSAMFAVFKAIQWENYGLSIIDSSLSYSMIDILMGGPKGSGPVGIEGRQHTAIERALIEKLITLTLNDLSVAFTPVCNIDFLFERLEVSSRFAAIARASNAVVIGRFHIDMEDRNGNLDLVLPYVTLEPVREQLTQQFMGESFGKDSKWENNLFAEILETDVEISASFEERKILLGELLTMRPGTTIEFPHRKGTPIAVKLQCGQIPVFAGHLGKLNGNIAVKIEKKILPMPPQHEAKEQHSP